MGLIDGSRGGMDMGLLESRVSHVGTGGGVVSSVPGDASGAGGDGGEKVALNIFPWWLYGPEGTEFFFVDSQVQVVAIGASDFALPNAGLVVGKGRLGVITSISLLVQSPTVTDDFVYTMKRNGGPEPGLDRLRNYPVAAAFSLREMNGYVIRLAPQTAISWSVTNAAAAAVSVAVSYVGWTVPESEVRRIQRGVNY